jgi:TPR repeat protein
MRLMRMPEATAKALRLIRPLVNDGDASAQFNLGLMYTTGQGVQQDNAAAVLWFRKAAEQGYALAQSNPWRRTIPRQQCGFGRLQTKATPSPSFYSGTNTQTAKAYRRTEAMTWFRKAAEQGHRVARLYLGVMYGEGRGVPQDFVRAHMWFDLSAAQGEQKAVKARDILGRSMTPAQIAEAQKLARDWKPATQPTPH